MYVFNVYKMKNNILIKIFYIISITTILCENGLGQTINNNNNNDYYYQQQQSLLQQQQLQQYYTQQTQHSQQTQQAQYVQQYNSDTKNTNGLTSRIGNLPESTTTTTKQNSNAHDISSQIFFPPDFEKIANNPINTQQDISNNNNNNNNNNQYYDQYNQPVQVIGQQPQKKPTNVHSQQENFNQMPWQLQQQPQSFASQPQQTLQHQQAQQQHQPQSFVPVQQQYEEQYQPQQTFVPSGFIPQQDQNRNQQPLLLQTQQQQVQRQQPRPSIPLRNPDSFDFVTDFSWNLFKETRLPNPYSNLVISPIGPELLLSILSFGAESQTKYQIENTLQHPISPSIFKLVSTIRVADAKNDIQFATALFHANFLTLNKTFEKNLKQANVHVMGLDFGNVALTDNIMNSWVSRSTKNRITKLFEPNQKPSKVSRLILANAMYFRGLWMHKFPKAAPGIFYPNPNQRNEVQMMKLSQKLRYGVFEINESTFGRYVELPYDGDRFSMVLILPSIRHGLDDLIRQMSSTTVIEIITRLKTHYKPTVNITMPKFTISTSTKLINSLMKMGITDLFTADSNLPYLTLTEQVAVDDVLQQAVLSVDEKGTAVAAATTFSVITLSVEPMQDISFVIDEPFLSIIVDKPNEVPIFISKIYNPIS